MSTRINARNLLAATLTCTLLSSAAFCKPPPGPIGTAQVTIDQRGMPFVLATSPIAGYEALCHAMANDRLFQMDLLRRSAFGQLAQIFGAGPADGILQQDRLLRVQDIERQAGLRLSETQSSTRQALQACADGVNRYIGEATLAGTLPPEFGVLGYAPQAWSPRDSVGILIYLGAGFSNIGTQTKLQRAALGGVFGPAIANDLIPPIPADAMFDASGSYQPPGAPLMADAAVPKFTVKALQGPPGSLLFPQAGDAVPGLSLPRLQATNVFAVGGARTASGKPLLANDPHLALNTPSPFWFAQLRVTGNEDFSVRGATIPGVPIFLSAQNDIAAWGICVAGIDDTDLYVESISGGGNGSTVQIGNQTFPVVERFETIAVAGQPGVTQRVRTTPHGTLLNDALPALDAFGPIAIKPTYAQSQWKIDGYFRLPSAQSWGQFQAALNQTGIGLNFLYADRAAGFGNIAYRLAGLIPQRNPENLYVPVSGADAQHEWNGYATAQQLPAVLNPPGDVLAVSNNRLVPDSYAPGGVAVTLGGFLEQPWRAQRTRALLAAAGNALHAHDLAALQFDVKNETALAIKAIYVQALQSAGLPSNDADAPASLAALQAWNGEVQAGSKGALIFEVLSTLLAQSTAQDVLGPQFFQNYVQGVFVTRRIAALQGLLQAPHAPFFGIGAGDDPMAKRDLAVREAMAATDAMLHDILGPQNASWTWGGMHRLVYNHPLAGAPIPGNPFALPDQAARGDFATLDIGSWGTRAGLLALPPADLTAAGGLRAAFAQDAIATFRSVMDLDDPALSLGVSSTGQSGNPFSPHWMDDAGLWRAGYALPMAYDGLESY